MEDMFQIKKYQNITDRLARLMKSPRTTHNTQIVQAPQKNYAQIKSSFKDSKNICNNDHKDQRQLGGAYRLGNEVSQTQSMKKIKSHDKLRRILNKGIMKQNALQQGDANLQTAQQYRNPNIIDKKLFFKNSGLETRRYESQVTKIIDWLEINQESNYDKRQSKNIALKNKTAKAYLGKEDQFSNKFNNQLYRPENYSQQQSKKVLINIQNSTQNQQRKQRIFGQSRHFHHNSTADCTASGKVKSQNRNKNKFLQNVRTEQSFDQINIQPASRYSDIYQKKYQIPRTNFKLQRNKSDFNRTPGRIFKNR